MHLENKCITILSSYKNCHKNRIRTVCSTISNTIWCVSVCLNIYESLLYLVTTLFVAFFFRLSSLRKRYWFSYSVCFRFLPKQET